MNVFEKGESIKASLRQGFQGGSSKMARRRLPRPRSKAAEIVNTHPAAHILSFSFARQNRNLYLLFRIFNIYCRCYNNR